MSDSSLPERIQTEDPSFVRDTHSRALLNTNKDALERHRRNLARKRASQGTVTTIQQRQERLESRLDEVTDKLNQILDFLKR